MIHALCRVATDPGHNLLFFASKAFQLKPGLMKAELKMTVPCHYIPYINGKKPA